jgi:TonB-dependent starch-binding outer membrane protein SusC
MKRTVHILVTLLLVAVFLDGRAQVATVKGKVTDQEGATLPGVNILIKGSTSGTTTDAEGNYSIDVSSGSTLVFSFIGYATQEITVGANTTINVTMATDATTLSEVVVIGYGTQERKDITGAVGLVDAKAFESRPNTQFGNLLQGKTAGVQVISASGKPSAGFSIRIRGTNSITASSEPLYVVDGVPSADTRTINPADIETITVLKDASSAAIYGAQASNGVVLITTKRGKNETPRFEFTAYTGFSSVWKTLDVLNAEQYRDLMTELGQNTDWSRYQQNTDWQNEIFRNGRSQNYQLAVSGKTDKTNYYLSGGWSQQNGAVRSSTMDRFNFKVNLEQQVNDWLKFGTNLNYVRYHDVDVNDNNAVNQGGVILGMISTPPNIGIYNPDGTFTSNPFQDWENPVASTDGSQRYYKNQRLLGNIYGEIQFVPGLTFRSNLGIDYSNGMYDYFLDPFRTSYGRAKKGIATNSTNLMNFYIIDNTLNYQKTIGDHKLTALAGSVMQLYKWEDNNIERNGFANDAVPTTNAGSTIVAASNTKAEKANASFIGRVTYDFKSKYLMTANFRADASSAFGPSNRWGYFPSVSVGWRLSEESFMQGLTTVNNLMIRAGWGIVGNDKVDNYAWIGKVGYNANYPVGNDGASLPGSYPSSIQNEDLKWEETQQTNLGVELSVLNSRLSVSIDAYVKDTYDLLLNVQTPRSTGFSDGIQNVGRLQNRGLEFQVTSKNMVGDLTWDTDFNISFNRNKVVDVLDQKQLFGSIAGRNDVSYMIEGQPLGQFYGYIYGGVDPATGMAYYVSSEGNSTFAPSSDTDRTIIGNPNPDFIYGMTNTVTYKNFELNIFIQGSQGNDILNATRIDSEGMSDPKNQSHVVVNRWRQPGDVTDIPRAVWANSDNTRLSTRFVEDGSYLRVKALTLAYNLPVSLLSKVKMNNAKIYVTGENLLTLTNYSGFDPEVNAFGGSNTLQGVDFGTYPQTRNLIFGLSVTF